ncbi:MAG TPA: UPF0182 family protein, partial [Terriglobales bacterium]|nr:UPF0182 family protein [Terriglobales bacterium]
MMHRSSGWPPVRPTVRPSRRPRWLLVVLAAVAVVLLGGRTWLSYYIDALWFGSLGYGDVFWKTLSIQSVVFLAFAAATFAILYGTFLGLQWAYLTDLPIGHTIWIGGQPLRLPVEPILRLIAIAASLLIALASGAVMMAQWPTLALYWYAQRTVSVADPIFAKPLSFYLFTLPAWELIAGWLMLLAVINCGVAVFFVIVAGGTRALERSRGTYRPLSWRGLSLTFAFFLLMLALQVYLGRFDKLMEGHTVFSGVTYTDSHVLLPGLLVVCIAL